MASFVFHSHLSNGLDQLGRLTEHLIRQPPVYAVSTDVFGRPFPLQMPHKDIQIGADEEDAKWHLLVVKQGAYWVEYPCLW